jgi:hypothetical protein
MEQADVHIRLPKRLAELLKRRRSTEGVLIRKQIEDALLEQAERRR